MDALKAGYVWLIEWDRAARCARHMMQQAQTVPTPLVSFNLMNHSKFSFRSLENPSRALARWKDDFCRLPASSASRDNGY